MNARYLVGGILVLAGISALLGISFGRFIFPMILIWLGWNVISKNGRQDWQGEMQSETISQSRINETLVFTGAAREVESSAFEGGKVTAVFSGAEVDLSRAKPAGKVVNMELTAIFGGIKMKIPQGWKVESEAVSIVGGMDNRTTRPKNSTSVLRVTGAMVFGGVEIYH